MRGFLHVPAWRLCVRSAQDTPRCTGPAAAAAPVTTTLAATSATTTVSSPPFTPAPLTAAPGISAPTCVFPTTSAGVAAALTAPPAAAAPTRSPAACHPGNICVQVQWPHLQRVQGAQGFDFAVSVELNPGAALMAFASVRVLARQPLTAPGSALQLYHVAT